MFSAEGKIYYIAHIQYVTPDNVIADVQFIWMVVSCYQISSHFRVRGRWAETASNRTPLLVNTADCDGGTSGVCRSCKLRQSGSSARPHLCNLNHVQLTDYRLST